MLIANKRLPAGHGLAPALVRRAAVLRLDWDTRQKSRFDAEDSTGRRVAAVLPRGTLLRGGDVLLAEDGTLVRIEAAPQPVLRVTAAPGGGAALALLRAAYHLGNRHVALEVHADHLQLEADHVLGAMLQQMGLVATAVDAPFEPEAGAYAVGGGHGTHDHGATRPPHGDDHAHAGHGHGVPDATGRSTLAAPKTIAIRPSAVPHAPPVHVHGPGCGHDHG